MAISYGDLMASFESIKGADEEIYNYIKLELARQKDGLEMIPSENFASEAVLEALGSVLTNKYSEGYPGRRYYGGNQFIDMVERAAIDRAKALFKVPYANVQPYSGSPANMAIYFAVCKPGDAIMGMNLSDGGHLTHGWKTSVSGQLFRSVPYHVNAEGYIDIDEVKRLAEENRPRLIWIGATAYTRELPFDEFSRIADDVGAYLAADISHVAGLVVAGAHKSPVPYAHIIMTTTHKTLRGPRGAIIMVTEKGLAKDPELDQKIEKAVFPGMQGGPHENAIAGIAVALAEAAKPSFKEYGMQIVSNARALAESLSKRGIKLVTGGTDNHMLLIDLTQYGKGKGIFVQEALDLIGITVNKNTIPREPSSPFYPSGIRLGTPALTTRGMKEAEMDEIGNIIASAIEIVKGYTLPEGRDEKSAYIKNFREEIAKNQQLLALREKVLGLSRRFPIYENI